MDRIRIADPPPTHCSACFQQKPELRHVDFGAHYDGPVLGEGVTRTVIDELILCEECLKPAAELVGLGDVEGERDRIQRLTYENQAKTEQLAAAMAHVNQLEAAQRSRDDLEAVKKKAKA